jgi:hypothetical protein
MKIQQQNPRINALGFLYTQMCLNARITYQHIADDVKVIRRWRHQVQPRIPVFCLHNPLLSESSSETFRLQVRRRPN